MMTELTLADPEAWVAQVLWAGRVQDIPSAVAAAKSAGFLSDPAALDRAADYLSAPPARMTDGVARLRQFGLALMAEGECRLQMRVWRTALDLGMEPQNGWQRFMDAASAAGDSLAVLEAGAWLLALPKPRPHWIAQTRAAVLRLLDGAEMPQAEAIGLILRRTGLRFLPELLQSAGKGPVSEIMVAGLAREEETLPFHHAILSAMALAYSDGAETLRRVGAILTSVDPKGISPVIAKALSEITEGRLDSAHSILEGLQSTVSPETPAEFELLWALAAAGAAHPALPDIAQRLSRKGNALELLSVLVRSLGDRSDEVPAVVSALTNTGLDPLSLLDIQLDASLRMDDVQIQHAISLVDRDTTSQRRERVLSLASRLLDSEQSVYLAADFCRRHAADLVTTANGSAYLGRALAAAKDWEGSLTGWNAVIEHQPGAAWALGRAYFAAAKAGHSDIASGYLKRINLEDNAAQPALLNVAYGACLLDDFETASRCLKIFDGLPDDNPARSQDRFNLSGRLQAVLSGSADMLSRYRSARAIEPTDAPPPRVLLLDPGFAVNDGHHFAYTQFAIQFFASEMAIKESEVWVCAGLVEADSPEDHRVIDESLHRLFGFSPYSFEEFPKTSRIITNVSRAWEAELTRVFSQRDLDAVEVIYCHSMKANMAEGLAAWIGSRFRGRRLSVILGIIEVDYMGEGPEATAACNAAYLSAVRQLCSTPGVHLVLYAETAYAVSELAAVLGDVTPVHAIPYLAASLAGPASTAPIAFSQDTVTVGLVGGSRRERGLDLFPELMLSLADVPELRWIVQMSRPLAEQIDPVFPLYLQWAVDRGICTWFDGRLSTDEYHAALRRMDVVLMPYRERYAVSGSGVFYEAIELERYLMVPEGTFMVDVLRDWSYPSEVMGSSTLSAALRSLRKVLAQRRALYSDMVELRGASGARLPVGRFRNLVRSSLAYVRGLAGPIG